jgi:tRNA pseudouridine55 synthase
MTSDSSDFVLPVDKPVGPTSHDVVALARRALQTRRIGHTGTLDPFASGLLLLCVNRATRIAEYLVGLPKTYSGVARLDAFTDTDDGTGARLQEFSSWEHLDRSTVEQAMSQLTGELDQVPPAYSAKKIDGQRMHDLARRGVAVQAAPVRVHVHRFELKRIELPEIHFEVDCSSGTYIRALARDLGRLLGTGGYLSALRRTRVGNFDGSAAISTDGLLDRDAVANASLPVLDALAHLPRIDVDVESARRLTLGQPIARPADLGESNPLAVASDNQLIAIARVQGNWIRPTKVWATRE